MKITAYTLAALLIMSVCGSPVFADGKHEEGKESARTWKEKRFTATVGADGIQKVEIIGGDYYYDPNYIIVKVNRPVEMKVRKAPGYIPHNLKVTAPEAGIDINIDVKGEPMTLKFTPTKVGKYPMFCDKKLLWFESHREKGMEGMIEVVE